MIDRNEFSTETSAKNNFDFLRLLFALSVLINHFGILTNRPIHWPISSPMAVAGFFIISGFLITKSYYRSTSLKKYYIKRIKRIIPAYLIIVITCAVGLSFFSNLPASAYFTSNYFFKYLLANLGFLNFIQPTLPGVFTSNPFPFVNGSLWTIKIEIALYLSIPVCAIFIRKIEAKWVFIFLYLLSFGFSQSMNWFYNRTGKEIYMILDRQFVGQFVFFASGMFLLFYFDSFRKKLKFLFPVALIIVILGNFYSDIFLINLVFPLSFAMLIIGFAYNFRPLNNIAEYGDISYGIYLFHYPIIQLLISINFLNHYPIETFILCLFLTCLLAFISWHLLEKKLLKRLF